MRNWIIRYAVFIIGLYFLTLGVVLIIRSSLGTSPISSFSYVLSLNTPLTLGMATFILNMLLIAGQFWFLRGTTKKLDFGRVFCLYSRLSADYLRPVGSQFSNNVGTNVGSKSERYKKCRHKSWHTQNGESNNQAAK